MAGHTMAAVTLTQALLQRLALVVVIAAALALLGATILATFGQAPWLRFSVAVGETRYDNAGQIFQIGLTGLAVILCVFLPSNARIMRLENSHRRFSINMQDVAQAYALAHGADREGLFTLSSEFDAVRERLAYLSAHPDLGRLEPALLEVAAQMSFLSRELAEVYSDEKVARARDFLTQRQQELEAFDARLEKAKLVSQELKHWAGQVDLDESVAQSQLRRLRDDLHEILPELEQRLAPPHVHKVVDNSKKLAD